MTDGAEQRGASPEVIAVWALYAAVALAILVTYTRLPLQELYHVGGSGLEVGAGRALVFVNFPVALVSIGILLVLLDGLSSRWERALALAGIVLSAAVFWPDVVTQRDLDARPVNAIAAVGVLIALGLTVWSSRGAPLARFERQPGDAVRVGIATVLLALALPWIAAELGFSFDGIPVLGTLYQTGELRSQPGVAGLHTAVHHGHHHGGDGTLLCLTVLLLSRVVSRLGGRALRGVFCAYLALMFCYGLGNIANDWWLEQVVKRGWTTWQVPDVTVPKASVAWAVIVASAAVIWLVAWTTRLGTTAVPDAREARSV